MSEVEPGPGQSPYQGDREPQRPDAAPRRPDLLPLRKPDAAPRRPDVVPLRRPDAAVRRPDVVPLRRPDAAVRRPDLVPLRKPDAVPVEARAFQGQRAGVVTRTAANTVDFLLMVVVIACGYAAWCAVRFLVNPTKFSFPAPSFIALLICFEIVLITYFTVSWATTGRTYGDHQLGLRVVNFRGERLGWPAALIRAGFCAVLPIGLYWAVLSPTNRSVQDSVLRTSVIYDWTVRRDPARRVTRPG